MRTETRIFLTVMLVYGFYVTISDPINNVDGLCVAMVDHHTFEIDQRASSDYSELNGKKYSGYSPGASWLLVPFYWVLKPLCVVAPGDFQFQFFTMLAGWLVSIPLAGFCAVALYRMLKDRQVSERALLITALAFAFGTMWFAYGRRHNSHSYFGAVFVFLAFYYVDAALRSPRKQAMLLWAGFVAGFAIACDYKQAISIFWVGIYVLLVHRSIRTATVFTLGAVPWLIAILAYDWHLFGHPLYTPSKFQVARFGDPLQPGLVPLQGSYHFHWEYVVGLLFGSHTGFFTYMPVTLLAIAGAVYAWKNRIRDNQAMLLTTAGIFGSHVLLAAGLSWWWAGGDSIYYGPATRYLLPAVPFVMLFVGFAADRVKPAVTWVLVGLSLIINWMFVASAGYGWGASLIKPGWEHFPLVTHGRYILESFGAESVWYGFLASSHFSLGKPAAAAITWMGALAVAACVWWIWRSSSKAVPSQSESPSRL